MLNVSTVFLYHSCALLRVDNITRAWEAGEITFFDDSFEHEVWNHCDHERVVLQVRFLPQASVVVIVKSVIGCQQVPIL
jgi:hypothetical protein